jgi:hypothetical protein
MKPPVPARLSEAEFAVLVARAGLRLTPEKRAVLHEAHGGLQDLAQRVRAAQRGASEPATIFTLVRAVKGP